jgi:glycosyltransferase involved in cell wall biosynthesis
MSLTIVSVAYPLTPVGPDAVGGSEQILTSLDAAIVKAGHRSLVVACEGSTTAGELIATPKWDGELSENARRWAQRQHRIAIEQTLRQNSVDIIHMHSLDWHQYLPAPGVPLLATLHLPANWYPEFALRMQRVRTHLNCVSHSARSTTRASYLPIHVVENGVPIDRLSTKVRKRDYVLALGRVCPEKGLHIALSAAKRAGIPMMLAGEVYRYPTHVQYFETEIVPKLDKKRKFLGPVGLERKRRLMAGARCLLVPSQVPETSSLVAMEAMACGTPVIAYASGALPEVVEHGRTGFIVHDEREMAESIEAARNLDPEECRHVARTRFSAERMAKDYMDLYQRIVTDREQTPNESKSVAAPGTPR